MTAREGLRAATGVGRKAADGAGPVIRRLRKGETSVGRRIRTWLALALLATVASAAWAGTAFFKYERPCTGFYKICVYDYLGEEVAITVRCVELCPITIQWD